MDWHGRARKARNLGERGRYGEAAELWRELVAETHSIEPQYDSWLEGLALCLAGLSQVRQAAYVYLYLQRFDDALALLGEEDGAQQAHILEQQGEFDAAAQLWESSGATVAAAIAFEREADRRLKLKDPRSSQSLSGARRCYEGLLRQGQMQQSTYAEALVLFNLGHCCLELGDEQGHRRLVESQRRLEESADLFETEGERERAFDCYQVLLEAGRRSGAFENLAEGYINCVRILRQDNLKYYALQYYEDFLQEALQWREYHAAASLYREVADYCRRTGMVYQQHYMCRAMETWQMAAEKTLETGTAVEMAENALLAAVECANAVGDFAAVGELYGRLGALDLGERKMSRYRHIAERYVGVKSRAVKSQPFPEYLRQARAYPQIWHTDLLEWERGGSIEAVCASVVGDQDYPEVVRRRALNLLLMLCEGADRQPDGLARVAEGLGDLQIYAVLSPLEQLMDHPSVEVQSGVMRALRFLFFKRSFNALGRGLQSEAVEVRRAAVDALGRLHFTHAFDPLQRIYRLHEDLQVRSTALESIGRIPSLEAGEFLLQVLREGEGPMRAIAKRRLQSFENREFLQQLRQQLDLEQGALRNELADILRGADAAAYTRYP